MPDDETTYERRQRALYLRNAGGTYAEIAARIGVSTATARKDVLAAKRALVDDATREMLIGEHRAVLLDARRANYAPMMNGDVDAARVVMSTLVREAEMFGLDAPKRSVIGVGTDVEFATNLVALIESIGHDAPDDLKFVAQGELTRDRVAPNQAAVIDAEIIPDPEPQRVDPPTPERKRWSNL